jgi:hypothetical protein
MSCRNIYLEIRNRCNDFKNYVEKLYHDSLYVKDEEDYFYSRLKESIMYFLDEFKSDKYTRCIKNLDKTIDNIKIYVNLYPDNALFFVYEFCSLFE